MTREDKIESRAALLARLEQIVGSHCYNGNIQNWGPNGIQYRDGREFRYPLTMRAADGEEIKRRMPATDVAAAELASGHYKFGSNRLHIIHALNEVLDHLEEHHKLRL